MTPETEEYVSDLLLWRDPDAHALLETTCQAHQIKLETIAEFWHGCAKCGAKATNTAA